jgi:transposase
LPDVCPDCGSPLDETHIAQQFQVEIPRKPIHRQFNIHVGQCRQCRRRVQGRHSQRPAASSYRYELNHSTYIPTRVISARV